MQINTQPDTPPWTLKLEIDKQWVAYIEESLGELCGALSCFEDDERKIWKIEAVLCTRLEAEDLAERLSVLLIAVGQEVPDYDIAQLPQKDWVTEVLKTFPPLTVGRYFVYGSHYTEKLPADAVALRIDAGMAFGSGEHATTSGCLQALHDLAEEGVHIRNALDMGCGSGILAFAIAKTWPNARIIGVDIDPPSVTVAQENAVDNGVAEQVSLYAGDGYSTPQVGESSPYDLIMSNILAGPLIKFAPSLAENLTSGGIAMLSGLLASQEQDVVSAHRNAGLEVIRRYPLGEWVTLMIQKPLEVA